MRFDQSPLLIRDPDHGQLMPWSGKKYKYDLRNDFYRFTLNGGSSGTSWVTFRMLAPVWYDKV